MYRDSFIKDMSNHHAAFRSDSHSTNEERRYSLEYLNFGESLLQWDKVIYSNPMCKIVNNDYFSESIKLSRGVKQGSPLLAHLFIMTIKMLAVKIRSNNNIKGLEIQGFKTKVSLYANDSCFL
jgi:hypothetical protein